MFAVKLRPLYHFCDKIIIRNIRNRRLDSGPHPGLNKRIESFKEEGIRIEDENIEEFIEQSDSNFYNVGEAYNEHMNETLMGKYELRHQIIKEKYFKENMPNLLTWSEKEQIRHLANTQPDEWTPEKIAESFPVTVPVVKRLLKYPWKPATEQRIARHDASVMRNWKELKENSLKIPEDLREQFMKFSNRVIPPLKQKSIKIDLTQERQNEKIGEFESIVRRCAAKDESNDKNSYTDNTTHESNKNSESSSKKDMKRVTLDKLTEKIRNRLDKQSKVDINDKIILDSVKNINESSEVTSEFNEVELFNDKNDQVALYTEKKEDNSNIMDYPERIRIPKKAYKKDATYKVNDCYYDHDGKFLYRVLGMSK